MTAAYWQFRWKTTVTAPKILDLCSLDLAKTFIYYKTLLCVLINLKKTRLLILSQHPSKYCWTSPGPSLLPFWYDTKSMIKWSFLSCTNLKIYLLNKCLPFPSFQWKWEILCKIWGFVEELGKYRSLTHWRQVWICAISMLGKLLTTLMLATYK